MNPFRTLVGATGAAFSTLNAGFEVARAVEARRMPPARALRRLGIDPEAFARIAR